MKGHQWNKKCPLCMPPRYKYVFWCIVPYNRYGRLVHIISRRGYSAGSTHTSWSLSLRRWRWRLPFPLSPARVQQIIITTNSWNYNAWQIHASYLTNKKGYSIEDIIIFFAILQYCPHTYNSNRSRDLRPKATDASLKG